MAIFRFSHNLVPLGSAGGERSSAWKGWQSLASRQAGPGSSGGFGCLVDAAEGFTLKLPAKP